MPYKGTGSESIEPENSMILPEVEEAHTTCLAQACSEPPGPVPALVLGLVEKNSSDGSEIYSSVAASTVSWPAAPYTVASSALTTPFTRGDQCVLSVKASDIVLAPLDGDVRTESTSLMEEIEGVNLRIDQINEKHEMVLEKLDELLDLLKGSKKG